ncbi:BspA family leucine-rich repeat surface protein [Enterococcus sp. DIV0756]|uniref:BspA family leucine-rich repeat surface protein n=1 Tax=Enterococcus sp. DIV0756 TaxID=2774636 RepID=UPI003F685AA6
MKKRNYQSWFGTRRKREFWVWTVIVLILFLGNYLMIPITVSGVDATAIDTSVATSTEGKALPTVSDEPEFHPYSESTSSSVVNESVSSPKPATSETNESQQKSLIQDANKPLGNLVNPDEWMWTNKDGRAVITSYSGDPEHIEIPATMNGLPVEIDLEAVLGDVLEEKTKNFSIEASALGSPPVKITGTFHGLFATVYGGSRVEGTAPIESVSFGNADTSAITDMSYMFAQCQSLNTLTIGGIDTQNVKTMHKMFSSCNSLTGLTLTNFSTKNVTDMGRMFENCSKLVALDVSSFDTENVTDFSYMFRYCGSVSSLDLTNFETQNGETMQNMFDRCHSLKTLDLSSFVTSSVTNMDYMFGNCKELLTIKMENFDTSNVTTMAHMFSNCSKLVSLDLLSFDTSNVTNMSYMFAGCPVLTYLKIGHFNSAKVTDVSYMFHNCLALSALDLVNFNTSSVTSGYRMFGGCNTLNQLRISGKFTIHSDFELLALSAPSNEGKTLTYWVRDDEMEIYDSTKALMDAHNQLDETAVHTYTIQNSHLVSFDLAGGSGDPIQEQWVFENKTVVDPGYSGTKAHHQFNGWRSEAEPFDFQTKITEPVILTADWTKDSYQVRYHANTGQGTMPNQVFEYDQESTLSATLFSKEGYTFKAWNSKADGTGEKTYNDGQSVKNLSDVNGATINLYAQWQPISYTVSFDSEGGSAVDAQKYTIETGITSFPSPSKKGYAFLGWYENGKKIEAIPIGETENRLLTAKWEALEYRITFDDPTLSPITYTIESETIKLPIVTRAGYTFLGWLVSEKAEQSVLPQNGKIVLEIPKGTTGDANLLAQWQQNQYTIRFEPNGGTGEMSALTINYDETAKLSANRFTRADHLFTHWNTQADGKGTTYTDAQNVRNLTAEANGSVLLYAQWQPAKTALEDLVNKEKETKRNKQDYTDESWKKYAEALAVAEQVLADPEATSEQVVAALSGLQEAITQLKRNVPMATKIQSPSSSTGVGKTSPTASSKGKSYPQAGLIVSSGLTIVGLAIIGATIALWRMKKNK